ncbi:MAG: NAD(P)-dependent oxidoreductase [Nakamurella sp.]
MLETRTVVVIATPLEAELVAGISAVDDRLQVRYEPDLLPAPRFVCDHRGVSVPPHNRAGRPAGGSCSARPRRCSAYPRASQGLADALHADRWPNAHSSGGLPSAGGCHGCSPTNRRNAGTTTRWPNWPGATVLVVVLGSVGARVARLAKAHGMRVIAVNRSGHTDSPDVDEVRTSRFLGDLLPVSHGVVLTLPLTDEAGGMIDAAAMGLSTYGCN